MNCSLFQEYIQYHRWSSHVYKINLHHLNSKPLFLLHSTLQLEGKDVKMSPLRAPCYVLVWTAAISISLFSSVCGSDVSAAALLWSRSWTACGFLYTACCRRPLKLWTGWWRCWRDGGSGPRRRAAEAPQSSWASEPRETTSCMRGAGTHHDDIK